MPGFVIRPPGLLAKRLNARVRPRLILLGNLTEERVREGFLIDEDELRAYVRGFDPITDDRPDTEYPLGKLLRGEPFEDTHEFILTARRR